jgi:hypothetical protein
MSGNLRTWFLKPGWTVDDTVWAVYEALLKKVHRKWFSFVD